MRAAGGWGLAAIFVTLALLHVYWAFGGRRGGGMVVPQRSAADATPLFAPPMLLTLLVAGALATAAVIELVIAGQLAPPEAVAGWFRPLAYVIVVAFLGRAIGERRYVGLLKRVRGTEFAWWDYRLFVPLCLAISTLTFALLQSADAVP
jgi:hypothetical protein